MTKRFPNGGIKNTLINTFEKIEQTTLNEDILEHIRNTKRRKIFRDWENGKIHIFLPQKWTLEYEIACSKLYKHIDQAIEIAKIEKRIPSLLIDDQIFNNAKDEIIEKYPMDEPSNQESYKIFKPLCKGTVSKASTAQYLAEILDRESKTDSNIVEKLKSDLYLKYICDAIYHVTEPIKVE